MTTPRSIQDELCNILDYLVVAQLAINVTAVSLAGTRVSFHAHDASTAFLRDRGDPSVAHYLSWVGAGAYSALLLDGGLLQLTYDVDGGQIMGHRLAYVPCPYKIDRSDLDSGEPMSDIVDLYLDGHPVLRSPIRFDFDPGAAKAGHPAVHLTFNSSDCRIACIAPLHPLRFVDFVFRHFYSEYWRVHRIFFDAGPDRHLQRGSLAAGEARLSHIMWTQDSLEAAW